MEGLQFCVLRGPLSTHEDIRDVGGYCPHFLLKMLLLSPPPPLPDEKTPLRPWDISRHRFLQES